MTDNAYENGHRVPTELPEMEHHDPAFDELNDKLDGELRRIVDQRVTDEGAQLVWEAVSRFAVELRQHANPLLTLDAFCFAAGLFILEGKTVTELAAEHGVTKQALSKRIVAITKSLGLPPSRGMKSEKARESYRKAHTE